MTLPRIAFTYWHQGFDEAPPVAKACLAQLRQQNPDWDLQALDGQSSEAAARRLPISRAKLDQLGLAHRSDLIRTQLLIDHGGVWCDPTVFVTQPFDDWLPAKMNAGVFFFSNPGRDRLISNWFIAAEPSNPLLVELVRALCAYWEGSTFRNMGRPAEGWEGSVMRVMNRNLTLPRLWFTWPFRKLLRLAPYMVYHYLVCDLVRSRRDLKRLYERMPKVSADGPHALQRYGLSQPFGAEATRLLNEAAVPVHKLTWKVAADLAPRSVLQHLIQSVPSAQADAAP